MHNPFAHHQGQAANGADPFVQFRRLLLGTMLEILRDSALDIDLLGCADRDLAAARHLGRHRLVVRGDVEHEPGARGDIRQPAEVG